MASNDKIILDQVLDQQRQAIASSLDPAKYFEVFTAEQILKDYDLSYDELEAGIVAGGGESFNSLELQDRKSEVKTA